MTKGGGAVAGAIIGSVIISVLVTGAGAYFLLPRLFPGMNGDSYTDVEPYTPAFEYKEFDSTAQLLDSDLLWSMVPDTYINITVVNGSRVKCTYSASALIGLMSTLGTQEVSYEIALGIEDYATLLTEYWKFVNIQYNDADGVTGTREISFSFGIELVSAPLLEGVYRVSVWWRSEQDVTGMNYLLFNTPSFDYNRSLSALEICA